MKKTTEPKPIEYYVRRNDIVECVGAVAWRVVAFIVLGILIVGLAAGDTTEVPKTIPARLEWQVGTNWSLSYATRTLIGWYGDHDPNVTTYHEIGIVSSNLVALVEWKGKTHGIPLETVTFNMLNRSYTKRIETNIVYSEAR